MDGGRRVTPVHTALIEPLLIAGVEKPFAILNATITAVFVLDLGFYGYLPVALLLHWVLRRITQGDPFARRVYIRYNLQADVYDPWPHAACRRGRRPRGAGRGALC